MEVPTATAGLLALRGNARGPHGSPMDVQTAISAPTGVQLHATCDHFIRASWKYKGDKVDGFEVTLTEKVSNVIEKLTLSPSERHVVFKIDPYRRNFTFTIRAYVYGQNRRHWSEEVVKPVTSFGQAPDVDGFEAHAMTATSARATWKTVHSEDIHISVCTATGPDEDCKEYITDGDLLTYVIYNLKPATGYVLHASFSLELNGTVCKYKNSSQTITTPAPAPRSLKARVISTSDTTATIVCEGLEEHEQVRVTVNGVPLFYDECAFIVRGLAPAQKNRLQIAACANIVTCTVPTVLEVMTRAAGPSASPIFEVTDASMNLTVAAYSTEERRFKPVVPSSVTSTTMPRGDHQPSYGRSRSALPVLDALALLTALLCCLETFKP